ncbi:MAG: ABC transporter substrate-binding protein [Ilumatobacteraceae bacterium]
MKHTRSRHVAAFTAVLLSGLLVGCGGDSSSTSTTEVDTSTVTTQSPQRILSLSPTHTEILFAIGAGDQVVAVDSLSNHPSEAAAVLTEISAYEPNVEAISEFEPDLVVIGDDFTGLAEQLSAIGIDSWTSPAPSSLDEVYAQITDLGGRVGRVDGANELVEDMRGAIEAAVATAPQSDEPLTYYHELDDMYYSVTSNTFIGSLYGLFGLRNIADAAEGSSNYPQLSAEFIVSQNPRIIFLADTKCCAVTAQSVAARPGWEGLAAVIDGHVVELDDDIASRWGPRVVDYVEAIAEAVAAVVSPA